ncbi:MAG TPA: hypothetical protein VIK16_05955, partial [Candidatus Limnocylindrales bacterium]
TPTPTPTLTPTPEPTPTPDPNATATPGGLSGGQALPDGVSLRVHDPAPAPGLVGGLMGSLLTLILGS